MRGRADLDVAIVAQKHAVASGPRRVGAVEGVDAIRDAGVE